MSDFKQLMMSIIMVFLLTGGVMAADSISFVDPVLSEILTAEYDLVELREITELDLRNQGIQSIAGLENLNQLKSLDLRGNPITDITAVSDLSDLMYLNLRETAVEDLSPLVGLRKLTYLNIHSTLVTTLDVIGELTSLETLIMRNVFIGNERGFLEDLTNLQRLNIRATGISNYDVLVSLMERGALQDQDDRVAEVDIRDNPLPTESEIDVYRQLRPYWSQVTNGRPAELPVITKQDVFLNEIVSSNLSNEMLDYFGNASDWIEIYNPNNEDFDLTGFYLSDDLERLDKWEFPQGSLIDGAGYLVVFASGEDSHLASDGECELHTNFSIARTGEPIIITNPEKEIVDYIPPVEIPQTFSYGRVTDGASEFIFFSEPTPREPNSAQ